nr:MAG TPA: hypothetical protein [Caudoviricetes sp.]
MYEPTHNVSRFLPDTPGWDGVRRIRSCAYHLSS